MSKEKKQYQEIDASEVSAVDAVVRLKPCPFCGQGAEYSQCVYDDPDEEEVLGGDQGIVQCGGCDAMILPDTKYKVVKLWNSRV